MKTKFVFRSKNEFRPQLHGAAREVASAVAVKVRARHIGESERCRPDAELVRAVEIVLVNEEG